MSLIIPANSAAASGGYQVANSCRFNDGSSDSLTRSLGASETSTQKGTFSYWIKRSTLSTNQITISNEVANDNERGYIQFNTSDNFRMVDENGIVLATNAVYRDTSAFYHFVIALDSTLGTTTDRVKLYVNGVRETSFQSSSYFNNGFPNQNINFDILTGGQTNKNHIGKIHSSGSDLDAYLAEFVYIDGTQNAVTDFGEFDEDSGIWKPIDVSGLTFGNNGFYLDFESSGSLGADVSGESNNFTVNNLTAIDQSTDTCTTNFATMNPLLAKSVIFAEGNLSTTTTSTGWHITHSTIGITTGKWYMECKIIGFDHCIVGLGNEAGSTGTATYPLGVAGNYGYNLYNGQKTSSDGAASYGATLANNDILGIAIDLDNLKIYFSKNGTYQNSGNPTSGSTGTGSAFNLLANQTYFPMAVVNVNSTNPCGVNWNFGSPAYAISSGNTDGDGYGNFEYAVPSGYFALNTKNLAEYG